MAGLSSYIDRAHCLESGIILVAEHNGSKSWTVVSAEVFTIEEHRLPSPKGVMVDVDTIHLIV